MPKLLQYRYDSAGQSRPLVYKPDFMDIIASKQLDIAQARKRVKVEHGKYSYQPSPAYFHFLANTKIKL